MPDDGIGDPEFHVGTIMAARLHTKASPVGGFRCTMSATTTSGGWVVGSSMW